MAAGRREPYYISTGRDSLAWAAGWFVAVQVALTAAMEHWHPELRDQEVGMKLARLQAARDAHSEQPLLLMVGSSRTLMGFRPESLRGVPGPDGRPLWAFNFGITMAGPMREYGLVRGLFDRGVKPALLLVEVMPPLLNEPGPGRMSEESWLTPSRLSTTDLARVGRYHTHASALWHSWLRNRVTVCHSQRHLLLNTLAPSWAASHSHIDTIRQTDITGWLAPDVPAVRIPSAAVDVTFTQAFQGFRAAPSARRALADLLRCCHRQRVPVVLVLMPEGSAFRAAYSAEAETELNGMIAELVQAQSVGCIDARAWVADAGFIDSHHLAPAGAEAFSRKLRAVLSDCGWRREHWHGPIARPIP